MLEKKIYRMMSVVLNVLISWKPLEITFYPHQSCHHSCGYLKVDQTLWIIWRGLTLNDFLQNPCIPGEYFFLQDMARLVEEYSIAKMLSCHVGEEDIHDGISQVQWILNVWIIWKAYKITFEPTQSC